MAFPLGVRLYGSSRFGLWILLSTTATVLSSASGAIGQALWSALAVQPPGQRDRDLLRAADAVARHWALKIAPLAICVIGAVGYHFARSLPHADPWRSHVLLATTVLAVWVVGSLLLTPPLYLVAGRGRLIEHYGLQTGRAAWRLVAVVVGVLDRRWGLPLMATAMLIGDCLLLWIARYLAAGVAALLETPDAEQSDCYSALRASSRRFLSLSATSLVNSAVGSFAVSSLGALSAVPIYAFVQRGAAAAITVLQTAQGPLTNKYGQGIGAGETTAARRTLSRVVVLATGAATGLWLVLSLSASVWAKYAFGDLRMTTYLVEVLFVYPVIYAPAITETIYISATARVRSLVRVVRIETLANTFLSFPLGYCFGVRGVALGQVVAAGVTSAWLVPLVSRRLGGGAGTRAYMLCAGFVIGGALLVTGLSFLRG